MIPRAVPHFVTLLGREDARELLAVPLRALCEEHGPARVARNLGGLDRTTVSDARDEKSSLSFEHVFNLLALDVHALDGLLGHYDLRAVLRGATCDTDALPALTCAVHQIASAGSPKDLQSALPILRAAQDALQRIVNGAEDYANRGKTRKVTA